MASMWRGSGSPFHRVMNWAATVVQLSILDCGTGGQ